MSGGVRTESVVARANEAVAAAQRAFPIWSSTPPGQRRRLLEQAAQLLMERQPEIATLVTEETGGTVGWGMFNVQLATAMLAYNAAQADALVEEEIPSHINGATGPSSWQRSASSSVTTEKASAVQSLLHPISSSPLLGKLYPHVRVEFPPASAYHRGAGQGHSS